MNQKDLSLFYADLRLPILVCRDTGQLPVEYMNVQASLIFSPSYSVKGLQGPAAFGCLFDHLQFDTHQEADAFAKKLSSTSYVDSWSCQVKSFDGQMLPKVVSANRLLLDGEQYVTVYLFDAAQSSGSQAITHFDSRISSIINATLLEHDVNRSIDAVLALSGRQVDVSRVYIFEEISSTMTRNTYEWCADGVEPAIQNLQNLSKEDYPYDVIIQSGMFITDDIREVDDESRQVLEMQGIKSLAIIPIYSADKPLGYVGFDDTGKYRKWSHDEIQFLKDVSMLLASLMNRRNAEQSARRSQEILQLVTDNSEDVIYANTLDDYRLVFVSQSLCRLLGKTEAELLGQHCYDVFRVGLDGPCEFCPIFKLEVQPELDRSEVVVWENYIERLDKTFLSKDNLVRWVDGQMVHMQVSVDISQRIIYEKQLQYYASTDAMTGVAKREWGANILSAKLAERAGGSLCFIDLDGLKKVNDSLGHTTGDEMLREVVRLIRENVPEEDFICRWGGDEFLLWLNVPLAEANATLQDIQQKIQLYNQQAQKPYALSFSYGIIAFNNRRKGGLDALVTAADKEMYQDKMAKRGMKRNRRREDPL